MNSLLRLIPYLKRYRISFGMAVLGMIIARTFEGLIPLFVKTGIDRIAEGRASIAEGTITRWLVKVGEKVAIAKRPGTMATIPPPTPVLAGRPALYIHSPDSS